MMIVAGKALIYQKHKKTENGNFTFCTPAYQNNKIKQKVMLRSACKLLFLKEICN
jgi:hypothetical protein